MPSERNIGVSYSCLQDNSINYKQYRQRIIWNRTEERLLLHNHCFQMSVVWHRRSSHRQPEFWSHPMESSPQAVSSTSSVCWTKWGSKDWRWPARRKLQRFVIHDPLLIERPANLTKHSKGFRRYWHVMTKHKYEYMQCMYRHVSSYINCKYHLKFFVAPAEHVHDRNTANVVKMKQLNSRDRD